ncbi:zf-HC2 domain-containing protein [Corynebacteriales bacterium D3-21]|uniref:Zf-HC2 domain-containing protein n=1 Tax=Speluncibacter jeojiensis TaxID=2710754 RepID=A0A9X4LZS0_9ACTN|nr:zf-HC2 domain-containing protein [Corynebacteriales bacterium D3-21]
MAQPVSPPPVRRFGSTEHLATEAVAAYVDGELRMSAHLRASAHLAACPECCAEVDAQRQARSALRQADPVTMPAALLGLLTDIPQHQSLDDVPPDSAGLGIHGRPWLRRRRH